LIESDGKHVRQTDYDFLTLQEAQDIVREEGIILLDYRALQVVWRAK
jgi:chitin disaccharide deacetylase